MLMASYVAVPIAVYYLFKVAENKAEYWIAFLFVLFFSCIFVAVDIHTYSFVKVMNFGLKGALAGVVYFLMDCCIFEMNTQSGAVRQTSIKDRILNSFFLAVTGVFALLVGHGIFTTFRKLL